MKCRIHTVSAYILLCCFAPLIAAQEENVVELSATVTGNQEQPKVIYIVPWKSAEDDSILYQPLNGKTDNVFGHVERSEHRRTLKFIKNMEAKTVSE